MSPWGNKLLEHVVSQSHFVRALKLQKVTILTERINIIGRSRIIEFGKHCECDAMKACIGVQCCHKMAMDKKCLEGFDHFWHRSEKNGNSFDHKSVPLSDSEFDLFNNNMKYYLFRNIRV